MWRAFYHTWSDLGRAELAWFHDSGSWHNDPLNISKVKLYVEMLKDHANTRKAASLLIE